MNSAYQNTKNFTDNILTLTDSGTKQAIRNQYELNNKLKTLRSKDHKALMVEINKNLEFAQEMLDGPTEQLNKVITDLGITDAHTMSKNELIVQKNFTSKEKRVK